MMRFLSKFCNIQELQDIQSIIQSVLDRLQIRITMKSLKFFNVTCCDRIYTLYRVWRSLKKIFVGKKLVETRVKKILEKLSRTRFLTEFEFRALFFGAT